MKYLFSLLLFIAISCVGQEVKFPFSLIKIIDSDLNTKDLDSIFYNSNDKILSLTKMQQEKFLRNESNVNYAINTFFLAYKDYEYFYSVFIKVVKDDGSEIVLVNLNKNFNVIDSKVIHGGFYIQPMEMDNGNVRWGDRNFSIISDDKIEYNQVKVFTKGFSDETERFEVKRITYNVNNEGEITPL